MPAQQVIGILFLALGLVSVSCYTNDLSSLRISWFYRELGSMQERWGKNTGTILHIIGYVVAPVAFGILFLMGLVFPQ